MVNLIKVSDPGVDGISSVDFDAQLQRVQAAYDELKEMLLHAGAALRIPVPEMIDIMEQNSAIRHMACQMYKAIRYLGGLSATAGKQVLETAAVKWQEDVVT